MGWLIELSAQADKQLDRIDRQSAVRILKYLRERLATHENPRQLGAPLTGIMSGYWRYRVGDYRLICEIFDHRLVVLVLEIGHRREVYR